ncbi:MAG: ABC transporter ATP-binding protein [Verrucomicrobiota bacterium]
MNLPPTGNAAQEAPTSKIPEVVISVSHITKSYRIWSNPADRLKYPLLRVLGGIIPRPLQPAGLRRRISNEHSSPYYHDFNALTDLSFEVRRGETVGIIGRNGSGKSTLLQIICGTLTPTSGSVKVTGRVAALLELGSGFNPEFTGRENVYLNASVLGLTREQIDERFDAIAHFADIGDFIEQPVKTYSSGMYVRLAFAIMTQVDADILVIDEALAVGDIAFTQKCMRFLRRFLEKGTIIFVSHDTGAIINLCQSAIWINQGKLRATGEPKKVTEAYLQDSLTKTYEGDVQVSSITPDTPTVNEQTANTVNSADPDTRISIFDEIAHSEGWKTGHAEIESVQLLDTNQRPFLTVQGGETVILVIKARANRPVTSPILGWFVKDRLGQNLFGEHTYTYVSPPVTMQAGQRAEARFNFQLPMLPNGEYSMTVSFAEGDPEVHTQHHWLHDAVRIRVASTRLRYGLVGIRFNDVTLRTIG